MSRLIYTYALIKSLYNHGEDYVDSFWSFTIQSLRTDDFMDLVSLQESLQQKCGLKIPLHVLATILKRARRKGYLDYKLEWSAEQRRELYKLTDKGLQYLDSLETQEEVDRRINALLEDMTGFFNENKVTLNTGQIRDLLLTVIQDNVQSLIEFINPSIVSEVTIPELGDSGKILIEYFKVAEQQKPDEHKTIQDMVLGSIITAILFAEEASDINDIATRRFKNCTAFLDTNFVFSILDLRRSTESNEAAKELFNLVKRSGLSIKVFDFTVDEMSRVLGSYFEKGYRYATSVEVDDISSCLKSRGWTKTDVMEFIANLEGTLGGFGIGIELKRNINLRTYQPRDNELRSILRKYKPDQKLLPQNHDLAAIECIEQYRGQAVRQIERCKAIFLTSDTGLSRFAFIELGHKENRTVSEAILDRLLTNILWLKNPRSKPPLKSIIATHSRGLFVRSRVWDKFYEILRELRREKKIEDENISMLFYHGYIEDTLSHFDENKTGEITPEFVLSEIEKAAKLMEEETEKTIREKVREKERGFLKQLTKGISKKEMEKESEWLEKIQGIKGNIRSGAKRSAKHRVLPLRILTAVGLVIPLIVAVATGNWALYDNIAKAIPIIIAAVGISIGSISGLWDKLEEKWFRKITVVRMKEAGLDKYE